MEKNYSAALAAHREELNILKTIQPESREVAIAFNRLAVVESKQGDYAAAERDYREALRIAGKAHYREGVAYFTGNLAELALDREDWVGGEDLARKSLEVAEALGQQEVIGRDCAAIAKSLARQFRPEEGRPYAERAVAIFARLRLPDELEMALATLAECGGG